MEEKEKNENLIDADDEDDENYEEHLSKSSISASHFLFIFLTTIVGIGFLVLGVLAVKRGYLRGLIFIFASPIFLAIIWALYQPVFEMMNDVREMKKIIEKLKDEGIVQKESTKKVKITNRKNKKI